MRHSTTNSYRYAEAPLAVTFLVSPLHLQCLQLLSEIRASVKNSFSITIAILTLGWKLGSENILMPYYSLDFTSATILSFYRSRTTSYHFFMET
jgi:hypothetical protein